MRDIVLQESFQKMLKNMGVEVKGEEKEALKGDETLEIAKWHGVRIAAMRNQVKSASESASSMKKSVEDGVPDLSYLIDSLGDLKPPVCVSKNEGLNRPGYKASSMSEYRDDDETLEKKLDVVAALIKFYANRKNFVVYTGAGISTSAGLGDYASVRNKDSLIHSLGSANAVKAVKTDGNNNQAASSSSSTNRNMNKLQELSLKKTPKAAPQVHPKVAATKAVAAKAAAKKSDEDATTCTSSRRQSVDKQIAAERAALAFKQSDLKKKQIASAMRLSLSPTLSHHCIAAMEKHGMVNHWLQQNHDRLAQKAGYPVEKINEIHGGWGDSANPVVKMSGSLRSDLSAWMEHWEDRVECCLVLGTSLCGMRSDSIVDRAVDIRGYDDADADYDEALNSLIIVSLQPTAKDDVAGVRLWGLLDEIMPKLCFKLGIAEVPNPQRKREGERWQTQNPNCRYSTPVVPLAKRKAHD